MTKKILIIDDASVIRQQVGIVLTAAGYEVLQAVDGLDGLQQIKANPDLAMVICDVNMPNLSGLEVLRRLRAEEHPRVPPILMLTTDASPASVGEARSLGAHGWIVKPFKKEILLACVKKMAS